MLSPVFFYDTSEWVMTDVWGKSLHIPVPLATLYMILSDNVFRGLWSGGPWNFAIPIIAMVVAHCWFSCSAQSIAESFFEGVNLLKYLELTVLMHFEDCGDFTLKSNYDIAIK